MIKYILIALTLFNINIYSADSFSCSDDDNYYGRNALVLGCFAISDELTNLYPELPATLESLPSSSATAARVIAEIKKSMER